jgi:hypothetical protein
LPQDVFPAPFPPSFLPQKPSPFLSPERHKPQKDKDTNEIYIEQTSDDSISIACTISGIILIDVEGIFTNIFWKKTVTVIAT